MRRVVVFPACRVFRGGGWSGVPVFPLGRDPGAIQEALQEALSPYHEELSRHPLYVSIDKDVLTEAEAAVNWDSGLMTLPEALAVLRTFITAAGGRLAGADVLGDWSPIELGTRLNRLSHRMDHPSPTQIPADAAERNGRANSGFLRMLGDVMT